MDTLDQRLDAEKHYNALTSATMFDGSISANFLAGSLTALTDISLR